MTLEIVVEGMEPFSASLAFVTVVGVSHARFGRTLARMMGMEAKSRKSFLASVEIHAGWVWASIRVEQMVALLLLAAAEQARAEMSRLGWRLVPTVKKPFSTKEQPPPQEEPPACQSI